MAILEVQNVKKIYTQRLGSNRITALSNVSFSAEKGEFIAIMGESGSGKTTLLNILAALDKPTSGKILLDGTDITELNEKNVAEFRRDNFGFVFQDFNLLDSLSVSNNILLPLVLMGASYDNMMKKLTPIAKMLDISGLLNKYPYELSGGQKQRTAAARAIITEPKILLADEPTGALDSKSSDELLSLFTRFNANGQTILMVTHSVRAASRAGRVLFIKDGQIFHQIYRGECKDDEMYLKITEALTVILAGGEMR